MSVRKICRKAKATIRPCGTSFSSMDFGYIEFKEDSNGKTSIQGYLKNMPQGYHGIHIHELGEGKEHLGCNAFGEHYNPFNKSHGPRTRLDAFGKEYTNIDRHLGDLGNIDVQADGTSKFYFMDDLIKLTGPYSVVGRSIIIHANHDDLGKRGDLESKKSGHSGQRLFYGIIRCE